MPPRLAGYAIMRPSTPSPQSPQHPGPIAGPSRQSTTTSSTTTSSVESTSTRARTFAFTLDSAMTADQTRPGPSVRPSISPVETGPMSMSVMVEQVEITPVSTLNRAGPRVSAVDVDMNDENGFAPMRRNMDMNMASPGGVTSPDEDTLMG